MAKTSLSLRDSAKQAMLWSAGLSLLRDVLQFGQMLVLARLLDPAAYGMAGLATTLINFIGLASFQHVIAHVLQIRADKPVNFHQHFTAGWVLNGALFLIANAIAFSLRLFEQYAHLQPLLHLLSFTFLLSVPSDMRAKMLERDHDWNRLRTLQLGGIVVSIITAIALAVGGAGVYALIVPGLLSSTIMALDLFFFSGWRPHWQWSYSSYREALHFGLNRAGSNALNGGRAVLQNTMITEHFQFAGLGLFARAEALANMFCGRIAQQASGALYPIITRAEAKSPQFQRTSGLMLSGVIWVVAPIAAFFSLESLRLVSVLYGSQWLDLVPLLPFAMGIGLAISIGATAYSLLLANDQARLCLRADMAAFVIAAAPMLLLIPLGLKTYLVGALAANITIAAVLLTLLIKTHGLQLSGLLRASAAPTVATALATTGAWALQTILETQFSGVAALFMAWISFTSVYVAVLRLLFRANLAEIVGFLPGSLKIRRVLWL
ncbi:MAG: oligosaccharide flippase family protein [Aeromicrobium sp.]|nr:oligosaccharide flippase family protein [Burkholderiales bacterium]